MTPHPTLAQRVEAAEGPDRELDADVMEALGAEVIRQRRHPHGICWRWRGVCAGQYADRWEVLPRLSYSLDSALALVTSKLPDCHWRVASCGAPNSRYEARILTRFDDAGDGSGKAVKWLDADAATPALALLAALLSTLESEHG